MPSPAANVHRFGVFELDTESGELRRQGLKIRLPEQSFQILKLLLTRPGEVVTRDELKQVLWTSDTFVDFEAGLNSAVRKLRDALDDSAENARFVETLPRRGYRFIASVSSPVEAPAVSTPSRSTIAVPAPRPRRWGWAAAAMLLMSIAGVIYQLSRSSETGGAATATPIRSLVVLPFENLTGDDTQAYFVDAVTDALTTQLAQVEGLDVISRTSARQYQRPAKGLTAIGEELKVDAVVEGSLVRSGMRVRVTTQLLRTSTDLHIWAQTYDSELGQMLALQQQIATDIARAAGWAAPAGGSGRIRLSIDSQAYEAYVKGVSSMGMPYESNRIAVAYFEEAIARQPDFAQAYAELAVAQFQFLFSGPLSPREAMPKAEAAARRAVELDDTLARAHWILGQILSSFHWKWAEADAAYMRADRLRVPGRSAPTTSRSALIRAGRFAEAIALAEQARALDPLSLNAQMDVATAYRASGQHARALEEFRRGHVMSRENSRTHFELGATLVALGRLDEAIRELEAAVDKSQGGGPKMQAYLAFALAAAGRPLDARHILNQLESRRRQQYVSWFGTALIHDALGEKEPALAALERAHEDRAVEFSQMDQYPPFKTIASEHRYQVIMQQIGLPQ
jgi:TolB-like protein/DNA-binding winged helix-turn-helix (wHTH) protein/tetratricopeptide (TPR) repeat protein